MAHASQHELIKGYLKDVLAAVAPKIAEGSENHDIAMRYMFGNAVLNPTYLVRN